MIVLDESRMKDLLVIFDRKIAEGDLKAIQQITSTIRGASENSVVLYTGMKASFIAQNAPYIGVDKAFRYASAFFDEHINSNKAVFEAYSGIEKRLLVANQNNGKEGQ
ncbi:MAG: hypothetical protein Q7S74_03720 [Nanoarchaeota archaeon]|nr:hypothetical protein [Nanoarchaeota archaeon]